MKALKQMVLGHFVKEEREGWPVKRGINQKDGTHLFQAERGGEGGEGRKGKRSTVLF